MKYHQIKKIFFVLILHIHVMHAQYYINRVIDYNGPTGQSENHVVMADSNHIYVLGYFTDSLLRVRWPFIAAHDYFGNIVYQDTLNISGKYKNFRGRTRIPVHKKRSIYYNNIQIQMDGILYNYIMELDLQKGKVCKYIKMDDSEYGLVNYMHYDKNNTITMVTFQGASGPGITNDKVQIIELDTNFNIIKHFAYADTTIIPNYIEKTDQGHYHIIGIMRKPRTPIFHMEVDSMGEVIDFDIHEFDGYVSFGWDANAFTVSKDKDNHWVIEFVHRKSGLKRKGSRTRNEFPYVMSYSYDFDTLIWQTPMLGPHDYAQPQIDINFMCRSLDNSGFVVVGDLSFYEDGWDAVYGKGLAFKVSTQGDSLWTRTYIAAEYDVPDSIYYWSIRMITPTPYGYALTGMVSDRHERRFRSILLHVDKEGCLVPGCDDTVNTEDIEQGVESPFKIYPNPVQDQLYILSRISSPQRYTVLLYDMNGRQVHKSYIVPEAGGQYIVFLDAGLSAGMYVLQIVDGGGKVVFTEKVVKE